VLDKGGKDLGIFSREEALRKAQDEGLDLVLINYQASPPIARILDWGKYRYLQNKKKKAAGGQRQDVKEIQLSLKIDRHDFQTKLRKAAKFLDKFGKIRVSLFLKGRENIYPQKAAEMMEKFRSEVGGTFDQPIKRMASRFTSIIKKDEAQNPQISLKENQENQNRKAFKT
jgi:translation initiation factor IF-3